MYVIASQKVCLIIYTQCYGDTAHVSKCIRMYQINPKLLCYKIIHASFFVISVNNCYSVVMMGMMTSARNKDQKLVGRF